MEKYIIEDLIRYHEESEYLDFKIQEYIPQKKYELARDVLAMANSQVDGDRYIIIGIKKTLGIIKVNDIANPEDSASIQQYIDDNIKPELNIEYSHHNYYGKNLMVLKIKNPTKQPYVFKRDISVNGKFKAQKEGMLIRKGSLKAILSRENLEDIYNRRGQQQNPDIYINMGFTRGEGRHVEIATGRYSINELNEIKQNNYPSYLQLIRKISPLQIWIRTDHRKILRNCTLHVEFDRNSPNFEVINSHLSSSSRKESAVVKYGKFSQRAIDINIGNMGYDYDHLVFEEGIYVYSYYSEGQPPSWKLDCTFMSADLPQPIISTLYIIGDPSMSL